MLRITEAEYVALEGHMHKAGFKIDGEIIPWAPENAARIHAAADRVRAIAAPDSRKRSTGFETLLARFDALNAQLEKSTLTLDDHQLRALGEVLLRLSNLAKARGVVLVQR